MALAATEEAEESEVTPVEDLMREHGVLRRVLLVYEEISRREVEETLLQTLGAASGLVRQFIEDYHEKLEEDYVFPAFEQAGQLTDLTAVLRTQHATGRAVTAELRALAAGDGAPERRRIRRLIAAFVRLYRPHAAREDTVLFPRFAGVVGEERYHELGETFEDREHELFGPSGFEGIVAQVEALEKQLGIYDLTQFTPEL